MKLFKSYILIIAIILFTSCGKENKESYAEKKMTIEQMEQSEPTRFLDVSGNYNNGFWGTKINIHGKIINRATVATYKDAVVKVIYYSKTKTVLGSKDYIIYELFPPNSTKTFELKTENYKDVNSIGLELVKALNIL